MNEKMDLNEWMQSHMITPLRQDTLNNLKISYGYVSAIACFNGGSNEQKFRGHILTNLTHWNGLIWSYDT